MNYSIILHRAPGIFSHKTTVRKTQAYKYRVAAYIIQETKINLCYMFLYSSLYPYQQRHSKKKGRIGPECNLQFRSV